MIIIVSFISDVIKGNGYYHWLKFRKILMRKLHNKKRCLYKIKHYSSTVQPKNNLFVRNSIKNNTVLYLFHLQHICHREAASTSSEERFSLQCHSAPPSGREAKRAHEPSTSQGFHHQVWSNTQQNLCKTSQTENCLFISFMYHILMKLYFIIQIVKKNHVNSTSDVPVQVWYGFNLHNHTHTYIYNLYI